MLILLLVIILVTIFWVVFRIAIIPKLNSEPGRYGTASDQSVGKIWSWVIFGVIVTGVIVFIWIWATVQFDQNRDKNAVKAGRKDEVNLIDHKEQIEKEITASLAKYPEIEERIVGDIDPAILVNYPQLKSNETITAQFEALKTIEEEILWVHQDIVASEKKMADRSDNPMNMGLIN